MTSISVDKVVQDQQPVTNQQDPVTNQQDPQQQPLEHKPYEPEPVQITEDLKAATKNLWDNVEKWWTTLYEALTVGIQSDHKKTLDLLAYFAGPKLTEFIDFEITVNELNKIPIPHKAARGIVELYITPVMKKENIPIMEYVTSQQRKLPNLHVLNYSSYNSQNVTLAKIDIDNINATYEDFSCQHFSGIDGDKALINIIVHIKNPLAKKILKKQTVTFVDSEKKTFSLEKWLPTTPNIAMLFLLRTIGEYNFIHNTGYIEFVPEDDPIIAPGSVFYELASLKHAYSLLDKEKSCQTCTRKPWQTKLMQCSKCRDTFYCCVECQRIDFHVHKNFCKTSE